MGKSQEKLSTIFLHDALAFYYNKLAKDFFSFG